MRSTWLRWVDEQKRCAVAFAPVLSFLAITGVRARVLSNLPAAGDSMFNVHGLLKLAGSLVNGAALVGPGLAATLTLETDRDRISFDTAALLARPDVAELEIFTDVAYHGLRRYRAVPLSGLLGALPAPPDTAAIEAAATDGFAAQIPLSLALGTA